MWITLNSVRDLLAAKPEKADEARQLLQGFEGRESSLPQDALAALLRLRGEVEELDGNIASAIQCWERAIDLNPKVGIKRRLDSLKKRKSARG